MVTWTDITGIATRLAERHPQVDPFSVTFPRLREMVEQLNDFQDEPGKRVNEQLLEAIQTAWQEERDDAEDGDDRQSGYRPHHPYR